MNSRTARPTTTGRRSPCRSSRRSRRQAPAQRRQAQAAPRASHRPGHGHAVTPLRPRQRGRRVDHDRPFLPPGWDPTRPVEPSSCTLMVRSRPSCRGWTPQLPSLRTVPIVLMASARSQRAEGGGPQSQVGVLVVGGVAPPLGPGDDDSCLNAAELQDRSGSSAACWPVPSWQLRSGGSSSRALPSGRARLVE